MSKNKIIYFKDLENKSGIVEYNCESCDEDMVMKNGNGDNKYYYECFPNWNQITKIIVVKNVKKH